MMEWENMENQGLGEGNNGGEGDNERGVDVDDWLLNEADVDEGQIGDGKQNEAENGEEGKGKMGDGMLIHFHNGVEFEGHVAQGSAMILAGEEIKLCPGEVDDDGGDFTVADEAIHFFEGIFAVADNAVGVFPLFNEASEFLGVEDDDMGEAIVELGIDRPWRRRRRRRIKMLKQTSVPR